ncbi:microtubule-binding protein TANGLED1-like isoform X1 [Lolium rigidum]|uniref:microtubule-binding protein TANGLED1-like isoform X1 n=1 Tax=Lolium rigidum TaxID=89674 RepID=UPI001F5CA50D|nr:microtubule-binding protein TANGLED1-like isoform X1 [Lolium rigidum]
MVARSPNAKADRQTAAAIAAAAALNPALVRETLKKMDRCMARLQELQYTVAGGAKVVSGVSLSPRSTRGYLRTSIRCKQETVRQASPSLPLPSDPNGDDSIERIPLTGRVCLGRMRATPAKTRSPKGKFGGAEGAAAPWRRMSLPAMLLGETVLEIVQASQFARDIVAVADPPKTPNPVARTKNATAEQTPLRARRAKEKQSQRGGGTARAEAGTPPSRGRVRSRIQFKPASPLGRPSSVAANRVSPKNRPWAKKTVMFPNPAFCAPTSSTAYASPSSAKKQRRFSSSRSPVLARQTPHKFLVKSPPSALGSKLKSQSKLLPNPRPVVDVSPPGKSRRCSFSPSRLATRLVSPIKARLSFVSPMKARRTSSHGGVGGSSSSMMSGLKQRPVVSLTARTVSTRISS